MNLEPLPTPMTENKSQKRLKNEHLINLRALIEANKYIDNILAIQPTSSQMVKLNYNDVPVLENSLHFTELLKMADELTQPKVNIKQIETPLQFAQKFFTNMFQKAYPDLTESRQAMFQNPVSSMVMGYYDCIQTPMCFLFVAMRLRMTDPDTFSLRINDQQENPLLSINKANYGSMLDIEQRQKFNMLNPENLQQLMKHVQELKIAPNGYNSLGDLIADVLLIACNCCYYNALDPQHYKHGKLLYSDCKEFLLKYKLWPAWAEKCIETEFVQQMNSICQKCKFDEVNFDDISDDSLRSLALLMNLDSKSQRETLSQSQLGAGIQFLKNKGFIK